MSNDNIADKLNYAIHPGEILQDALEAHQLTQKELADRVGLTTKHINEIIKGKSSITSNVAQKFEFVFSTSPGFWLNLQKDYEEIRARLSIEDQFQREEHLLSDFNCYADLTKLGFVKETRNKKERYTELLSFFGLSSLQLLSKNYAVMFRKTDKKPNLACMAAWLRIGEIHFTKLNFDKNFDERIFKEKLLLARELTAEPIDIASRKLEQMCTESGVLIAFTPYIKNTYVNGATRWFSSGTPLMQLTARSGRSDAFWFTFFHEAAHILKHSKKKRYIEWESSNSDDLDEQEANKFAQDLLIPASDYEAFVRVNRFDEAAIKSFSGSIRIGADIVAGRLARDEHISWPYASRFIKQIRVSAARD